MVLVCPNCSSRFKVKAEALGEKGRLVRCAKCSHKWRATVNDLLESGDGAAKPEVKPPAKKAAAAKPPAPDPAATAVAAAATADPPAADPPAVEPKQEEASPPEPATAEPESAEPDFAGPDALAHLDREDEDGEGGDDADGDDAPLGDEFDRSPPPIPPASHFEPREPPSRSMGPWISWGVLIGFIVLFLGGTYIFSKPLVEAYPGAAKIFMAVGIDVDILGHGFDLPQPVAEAHPDKTPRTLVVKGMVVNTTGETMEIPLLKGSLRDTDGADLASWAFRASRDEALPGESVPYETETSDIPQGATTVAVTFLTEQEAQEQGLLKEVE